MNKVHHCQGILEKVKLTLILLFILLFITLPFYNPQFNESWQFNNDLNDFKNPNVSLDQPNSKPLLVSQHSTITNTFFPLSLPTDVSFTLVEGWTSQNVTISYDGVAHKKDWVINGTFDLGEAPWEYFSDNVQFVKEPWDEIDSRDCVGVTISKGQSFIEGEYSYFEENFTIPEPSASNTFATLSMDYHFIHQLSETSSSNISIFISIDIGGEKKNITAKLIDLVEDYWTDMSVYYDLTNYNQQIPGNNDNITIRAGVIVDNNTISPPSKVQTIYFSDIQFTVWAQPNYPNLLFANDTQYNLNYTYVNSTFGKGTSFIDGERSLAETSDIIFTISKNETFLEDFSVYNITIISEAVKMFNSTIDGQEGSLYINDINIGWQTECSFSIPYGYLENWAEIKKPNDWNVTSIRDGFGVEKREICSGTNLGSEKIIIPIGVLDSGLWILDLSSRNYISNATILVWNGTDYNEELWITLGDTYQIKVGLNISVNFTNTFVNCTIEYSNGTLFYQKSKEAVAHTVIFGDFTVGGNMTAGNYQTTLVWTNNQSFLNRDKMGFLQFGFNVWHHANLTAVNPSEEKVSGEPYLMKVNFTDSDFNTFIDFATVEFNFTDSIGQLISFGTMVYFGSGIYVYDMDLSGLDLGDYYASFNASKQYFENQSIKDLIHVVIINQSLVLEVPHTAIIVDANSYGTCYMNVTGALTGTLLPGAVNITTDWQEDFTVTGNNITGNGIIFLNFSTWNVPAQGIVETFTITILATKVNFGSGSAFISLTVNPIPTVINVNETIVDVYLNNSFSLKLNYTIENSDEIIGDATLNVTWASSFDVLQVVDGYIINFSTIDLSLEIYSIFFQLSHPGFETSYSNVYVNIMPKSTFVEIFLNQVDKTSDKTLTMPWNNPLNITILYKESLSDQFISGATVELSGVGISDTLIQSQQRYTLILNPGELPIGINFLTITSQKENYDTVPTIIKITVEEISTYVEIFLNQIDKTSEKTLTMPWYTPLNITVLYKESQSSQSISGASIELTGAGISSSIPQSQQQYTIILNPGDLPIGTHYLTITSQKENYNFIDSALRITVEQIEVEVNTLEFNGTLDLFAGDSQLISLFLSEAGSGGVIENANVTYTWDLLFEGLFENMGNGNYETDINIPNSALGAYTIEIIIRNAESQYRDRNFLVNIYVSRRTTPNYTILVIVIALLSVIGVLSTLSLRSYVLLPRKRKKERIFQNTIQVFKDVKNIQALMLIQRKSGMPIYSKNLAGFDFEDNFLISGFIQAITLFGEQMINGGTTEDGKTKHKEIYSKHIIELNFKFFHLLICDYKSLRSLLILKEESSKKLKNQIYLLTAEIDRKFSTKIEKFVGRSIEYSDDIDALIDEYLFLNYNEPYRLIKDNSYLQFLKKSRELQTIGSRILNVIISLTKFEKTFTFDRVIEEIDEKNIELIYGGLHTLIKRQIIVPEHHEDDDSHPLIGGIKKKKYL